MMCGLLFARAGVPVTVLEKHGDFLRDFRGDTVHPSTMEVLSEIGLLDRFLERPHERLDRAQISIAGQDYAVGDLSHLDTPAPFIAMMPQWEFLDFLRDEAGKYPTFSLRLQSDAVRFIEQDGRIAGVGLADGSEIRPGLLTIMADGRGSLVRRKDILPLEVLGAPMDVFWFHLPKHPHNGEVLRGAFDTGRIAVLIDRRSYWQAAFVIPKGEGDRVRARGVGWVRDQMQQAFPDLDLGGAGGLEKEEDMFLLSVALDRLQRWHRPGLLAIGDAAHAMSPIGGIGINLAIQDAVAAANLLARGLAQGKRVDDMLGKVQQRRLFPTRVIQAGQKAVQDNIIGSLISGKQVTRAPWPVRILNRVPVLRRIPGRIIGLGVRREHVNAPNAFPQIGR